MDDLISRIINERLRRLQAKGVISMTKRGTHVGQKSAATPDLALNYKTTHDFFFPLSYQSMFFRYS